MGMLQLVRSHGWWWTGLSRKKVCVWGGGGGGLNRGFNLTGTWEFLGL